MQIKIKRFDKSLPLPSYKTKGAACMDLYLRETTRIEPGQVAYLPLNIAVEIPEGTWLMIAARGSTHKQGILPVHGLGIGDWDYRGDNDEYLFPVLNFTQNAVILEKGSRIAQMMLHKYSPIELQEVDHLSQEDRGGFGSTGLK